VQEHQETMLLHKDGLGRKALRVAVLQRPDLHFREPVPSRGSLHAAYLLRRY
jgi:hypothetical protein